MKPRMRVFAMVVGLGWAGAVPASAKSFTVVDDCGFIRDALAKLPAEGGEVVIPAGAYTCASPIVLDRDNLSVRGEGDVTLRLADNANAPIVVMGDLNTPPSPVFSVSVSHLKLDGNRAHQQMECWDGPCDSGGTAFIRNNGITVRGVIDGKINDVFITSPRSGGVVTEHGCSGLHVDGLTVTDSYFDGLAGYQTEDSDFNHMHFFNNTAAGISLDIKFQKNTIRNTRMENNDLGIFIRDSSNNVFDSLSISDSRGYGVFLSFVNDIYSCPTNNEFRDFTATGSRLAGFRLNSACEKNRLTGHAVFRGNQGGCISEGTWMKLGVDGTLDCEP